MELSATVPLLALAVAFAVGSCQDDPGAVAPDAQSAQARADAKPVHPSPAPALTPPALDATAPANYAGLHNVVTYHDGLYSGSVPEGEAGFETLKAMGVVTIISVDGATPEVETARALGMRYVHLPVGYDGVSPERTLELARAIHDLPGPIYVHCHHGKHRSAGATGAAAVTLGYLTPEAATARMKVSGTAPNYKGLYACVADARPVDAAKLSTVSNAFPEVTKLSGFVETMVVVDEEFDHLKAIEKAKWVAPADHPDLVPSATAARLENMFRQLEGDPEVIAQTDEFKRWIQESAAQAQAIEDGLKKNPPALETVAAQFNLLGQGCKQCHAKYRD